MNSELRSESDIGSGLFRLPKTDSKIILGTKYDKSNKSLFHVIWVGNILKTLIFYMPLVFKCHFIATTAIFRKIMKFFKKSDFFFVFEKKVIFG